MAKCLYLMKALSMTVTEQIIFLFRGDGLKGLLRRNTRPFFPPPPASTAFDFFAKKYVSNFSRFCKTLGLLSPVWRLSPFFRVHKDNQSLGEVGLHPGEPWSTLRVP